jgi:hypothetical protein
MYSNEFMNVQNIPLYNETLIALNASQEMLTIFEFIYSINFQIDTFMLDKFWQCIAENSSLLIQGTVLEWLGYDSKNERDNKASFIKLLSAHNIQFIQIKHTDPEFPKYTELVEEAKTMTVAALKRKKWIIMNSDDFKEMVMCLQTKKASHIRKYYLALEKLVKMYTDYTHHFQMRKVNKQIEKANQEKEQANQEKEQAHQEKEKAQQELHKQERFTNKLRDMVITIKERQKDQIIYISTTNVYARQNRFKVGGVKHRSGLKARLAVYNSGRPVGDRMYYAYITETTDYQHLEQRISKLLGEHKDTSETEMYNIHYDSLQPLVEYLADRFDEEIKHHQSLFERLIKETLEKQPTVPEPIILNGAEFRRIENGLVVITQKIDFDLMSDEDKKNFVRTAFENFVLLKKDRLVREDFERFVAEGGTKFNKLTLWKETKSAAIELNKKISYRK